MNRDRALAEIANRAKARRRRGAAAAFLFGSVARNEAREDSDIDVFIDIIPDRKFSLLDLAGIQNFLARELNATVDVTTRSSLHPMLRADIEKEAIRAF